MLTKQDIEQIKQLFITEREYTSNNLTAALEAEREYTKNNLTAALEAEREYTKNNLTAALEAEREYTKNNLTAALEAEREHTRKAIQGDINQAIIEALKPIKRKLNRLAKDVSYIARSFDESIMHNRRRIERIEAHLGLPQSE